MMLAGSAAIIGGLLAVIACSNTRAKEDILKHDLFILTTLANEYTYDKKSVPRSLQDLVTDGYLRYIPNDPITGFNRTWRIVKERASNGTERVRVKSGSDRKGTNGKRYSDW